MLLGCTLIEIDLISWSMAFLFLSILISTRFIRTFSLDFFFSETLGIVITGLIIVDSSENSFHLRYFCRKAKLLFGTSALEAQGWKNDLGWILLLYPPSQWLVSTWGTLSSAFFPQRYKYPMRYCHNQAQLHSNTHTIPNSTNTIFLRRRIDLLTYYKVSLSCKLSNSSWCFTNGACMHTYAGTKASKKRVIWVLTHQKPPVPPPYIRFLNALALGSCHLLRLAVYGFLV